MASNNGRSYFVFFRRQFFRCFFIIFLCVCYFFVDNYRIEIMLGCSFLSVGLFCVLFSFFFHSGLFSVREMYLIIPVKIKRVNKIIEDLSKKKYVNFS